MESEEAINFPTALDTFARRLYTHLLVGNPFRNLVCSPLAMQMCAGIIRMGIEDDSQAATELERGINFSSSNASDTANEFLKILNKYANYKELEIVNKIYIKWGYNPKKEFCDILMEKFHTQVENIDFGQKSTSSLFMNSWFETTTRGLITNIVYPEYLGNDTDMVLINTIHLRAAWTVTFDKEMTRVEPFYLDDEVMQNTFMMNNMNVFHYAELPELNATALRFSYVNCELHMLLVLPNKRTGLRFLEHNLMLTPLDHITCKLKPTYVDVKIPKFTTDFEQELTPIFRNFNIRRIFDESSEFTKILESNEKMVVSKILHKAIIEVTEAGFDESKKDSKSIMFIRTSDPRPTPETFYAVHPFYYAIYDTDHVRLLEGNLLSPLQVETNLNKLCTCQSRADQKI